MRGKGERLTMVRPYLKDKLSGLGSEHSPGRRIVGTHIEMADSICSEVLGRVGYDFVLIDADDSEHSYTSLRNHMTVLNSESTPTVVRVSGNLQSHVSRVLELGPDGIIFPAVSTAEEADNVMSLCLYPPDGRRRFSPLRAVGYGLDDAMRCVRQDSLAMCRFIQLDSAAALRNLPEIVKNPLIDGFFFSPGEVCRPDGTPDGVYGEDSISMLRRAADCITAAGKPFGVSVLRSGTGMLTFWLELGARIIASGVDFGYILGGAADNLRAIRNL